MIIWKNSWLGWEKVDKLYAKWDDDERQSLTPPLNAAIIAALFLAEEQEKQLTKRVLVVQTLIVIVATGIAALCWKSSPQFAIAIFGGGGVSVLNSALLTWRMSRSASLPNQDANQQLRLMYFYAAERFFSVVAMLGVCLVWLKLMPLGVLSGFILGQAVLLVARLIMKIKTENSD